MNDMELRIDRGDMKLERAEGIKVKKWLRPKTTLEG